VGIGWWIRDMEFLNNVLFMDEWGESTLENIPSTTYKITYMCCSLFSRYCHYNIIQVMNVIYGGLNLLNIGLMPKILSFDIMGGVTPSTHILPSIHANWGKYEMRGYYDQIRPPV